MEWIIVYRAGMHRPAEHGMDALKKALGSKGVSFRLSVSHTGELADGLIFAGTAGEPTLYTQAGKHCRARESFSFARNGETRLLVGADGLGLAYGLYELAERVSAEGERALEQWPCGEDYPRVPVRGVDRFISNSSDESWWMNREYWDFYFGTLLSSRYNSFTLMFGFDTAYFSPPYPFFVEVPGYDSVRVSSWFSFNRGEYLEKLNQIGDMCHDYGLEFSIAIWQQVPWQDAQKTMVEGLDPGVMSDYCAQGLKALAAAVPSIDKIHFRVNHESGVGKFEGGRDASEEYWLRQIEALAEFNRESGRDIMLELRAKGMTDRMVEHGKQCGLRVRVSTKYWCEQAGLPYHMTRMRANELNRSENLNSSRRYSYSDMLRRPRLHSFTYRLWNNGSTNLFTWGDPDYVRRFIDSLRLGDSDGFEVMPPLAYKGGHQLIMEAPWKLFSDPAYQPEGFEESRYWLFYRLFGRVGYNPGTCREAWMRPMTARFGDCAEAMMELTVQSSRVVPYLVGSHFVSHPQQEYWAELNTGAALFAEHTYNWRHRRAGATYQNVKGCDEGLFYSIEEYAEAMLNGTPDGRITPHQSAAYLRSLCAGMDRALTLARAAGVPDTAEARGVLLDAGMLRELAGYHIHKIYAALGLSMYQLNGDKQYACASLKQMRTAREHWARLAELGKAYHSNLNFSVGVANVHMGTWGDSLVEMDADLAELERLCGGETARASLKRNASYLPAPWKAELPAVHTAGRDLAVTLDRRGVSGPLSVRMRWRRTNQMDGAFRSMEMRRGESGYHAVIPGSDITPEYDLLVYFEAADDNGDGLLYPGLFHPDIELPYFIVKIELAEGFPRELSDPKQALTKKD